MVADLAVAGGAQAAELRVEQQFRAQRFVLLGGVEGHHDVDGTAGQRADAARHRHRLHAHARTRRGLAQRLQEAGRDHGLQGVVNADGVGAGFQRGIVVGRLGVDLLDQAQHAFEHRLQFLGAAGRQHFQRALDQQRVADFVAQPLQHAAGGRLRAVEPLGGLAHAVALQQCGKHHQQVEVFLAQVRERQASAARGVA
ncbi:hypothetical protein D3C86_1585130 [compost metagenome]